MELMPAVDKPRDRLTASGQLTVLARRFERNEDQVSLGEVLDGLGQTGLGMTLLVLTLPALIPIPGPFGLVFGLLIAFVSLQIMIGARRLWLPRFIQNRRMDASSVALVANKAALLLDRVEHWLKPRRLLPLTGRIGRIALAVPVLVMALTLALPIPLGNVPPAASLIAFALGLMTRDGLAVIVGLVLSIFAVLWMTMLILFGAEILDIALRWIGWS
jgi:hypothetical protein